MNITKISKCLINYRSIQHLRSIKTDSTKVEPLTDTELIENAVLTVEEEGIGISLLSFYEFL